MVFLGGSFRFLKQNSRCFHVVEITSSGLPAALATLSAKQKRSEQRGIQMRKQERMFVENNFNCFTWLWVKNTGYQKKNCG